MSVSAKSNKENFRLLDLSSDEESEDLQLEIIPSRKKKVTRRERNRVAAPKVLESNLGKEVQCALQWAVRGTLFLWLVMLTWICASLYDQVTSMHADISKVSITRNSVDDALQDCHTAVKELRNNASDLSRRLDKLELDHAELTKTVELIQKAQKEAPLAAAPSLAKTQRRLDDLQILVADLGSQINGFDGTINTARKQAVAAASGVEDVKTLFHQLEARSNETIANVTANAKRDEEIRSQVTALNTTLAARVDELQHRIEDMSKPTSTVAPTTSTTQSTSSSTSTTSTTTEVPEPPTKPSVLASV